ncbi:cytochrome C oxidase subunit IV family protein [uncultured Ruegeria sp.]|uniref:cytochrome C oxidase subunit IV family protein n=1 Tax=uncultured Ruegeria sp. TaxID=259304 RepID=UPI00261946EA|nr:cytochrome C oxidase subunit IV family protein [uncultured Ruegeria sp.]
MPKASSFRKYSRRRHPNSLSCAWLTLLTLSSVTALLTKLPGMPEIAAAGILLLALIKTRVILARYLDLAQSPAWLRGFTLVLTAFAVVIFVLYLI